MKLFHRQARSLKSIDIIWISVEPPNIEESYFSHKFCRKTSRKLCKDQLNLLSWTEIDQTKSSLSICQQESSEDLPDVFNSCHSSNLSGSSDSPYYKYLCTALENIKADYCLIVENPELVISPVAVQQMINTLENGYFISFPVYNETNSSCQSINLPVTYLNLSTYLEVSEIMAEKNKGKCNIVSSPDTSCALFKKEFLKSIDIRFLLKKKDNCKKIIDLLYSECEKNKSVIDRSALIHSFGNYCIYYSGKREDLAELVPVSANSILDVGCANGGFGEVMRKKAAKIHLTGVEMNSLMAKHAALYYDKIFCKKIEDVKFDMQFDHINCGDIIEHLYNPWQILELFYSLLKKGGTFVTSLPNAGHWTIVRDLANGEFEYLPVGLLCITHIRWFTENSIKNAIKDAGFSLEIFKREQIPPTPQGHSFIEHMCKSSNGIRESLLTNEFIIRAVKK